jgi:imidazoleglycerol phosphate dehydratase HisB
MDVKLTASGDDPHHLVEDVAICLGQAFNRAGG